MLHYICLVECIMDCIIWVLLRSDFYFTKKAWNAQNAGAAAILVADDKDEPLITMDTPEESGRADYLENITIPSALITKSFGDRLKKAIDNGDMINHQCEFGLEGGSAPS